MGIPQSPNAPSPHLYPQALQLKLYQAFIFSIPILFSIILFLLFYLFYLKRRASSILSSSSPTSILLTTSNQPPPYIHSPCQNVWTGEIKNRLPLVLFDEELSKRDSLCCVCLGEFEIKEELHQVPSCKHVFHVECIHHWLHSNATCPLCRCAVVPTTTKLHDPPPPPSLSLTLPAEHQDDTTNSNNENPENILEEEQTQEQQQFVDEGSSNVINNICREHQTTVSVEDTSSSSRSSSQSTRNQDQEYVVLQIQSPNT